MKDSSIPRTASDDPHTFGRRVDGGEPTVDELVRARYRHPRATGFAPDLAVALAARDVAGYLRVTGATRTGRHDRP
jgi:hypothetical protein